MNLASLRAWLPQILGLGVGVPIGVGILVVTHSLPKVDDGSPLALLQRYLEHPVEYAEIVAFFWALGMLLGKVVSASWEKVSLKRSLLPLWNGRSQPVEEATKLKTFFDTLSPLKKQSLLGHRTHNILQFVNSRGSANELDDQMRSLADSDAMALEGSYALTRFITWAIPILGFLGTVLGITDAIYGVTPELLEKGLEQVTGGLATAFDTTALALLLTMILMFFSFIAEKVEGGLLGQVDGIVEAELAHRFERIASDNSQFVEIVRQSSQTLLVTTEKLVERQASLWATSMEKADRAWVQTGAKQQEQILAGLKSALEATVTSHGQRLLDMEAKMAGQTQKLLEGMTLIANSLRDQGKLHQDSLLKVTDALSKQTQAAAKLQEGQGQLARLEQGINDNLSSLAASGNFEQAVQSLTAAIHLLTTRVQGPSTAAKKAA